MGPSVGAAVGEVSMYGAQVVGREEEKRIGRAEYSRR